MKHMKYLKLAKGLLLLALVIGVIAFAQVSVQAVISGSAHDFSGYGWSGGEICVACHTPHNADTTVPDAPLWNHEVTAATFTVYDSPTMDETPEQPQGTSKLCLSCHDGTVALDSFGGTTGTSPLTGDADFGTDLSDDHPISVYWSHQTEISTCMTCHAGWTPAETWEVPFFNHYVECASCHDVHNSANIAGLLVKSNAGSDLCLTCHQK